MMNPEDLDQNSTRRKRFTEAEDNRLKALVKREGIRNWEEIARRMPGRSSRQCRDRYNNYLFKEILHKPWSPEEDKIIVEKYQIYGPHWVKISQFLEARSGNNVKNRWHKYLSKNALQTDIQTKSPPNSPQTVFPSLPLLSNDNFALDNIPKALDPLQFIGSFNGEIQIPSLKPAKPKELPSTSNMAIPEDLQLKSLLANPKVI